MEGAKKTRRISAIRNLIETRIKLELTEGKVGKGGLDLATLLTVIEAEAEKAADRIMKRVLRRGSR